MKKKTAAGSAALCAILIMIMLLAIGTAAMVVTGRKSIDENDNMPANVEHYPTLSSEEASSESESSEAELPPQTAVTYPEKGFEFQKMDLEDVKSQYSVLYGSSDNMLYTAKNYTKKAYPASLTKIMTVIVALENCDNLQDTYKFTKADMKELDGTNASVAGFVAGEKVTVEDLLYGAMLPSGADATLGIAKYVAGSEEEFVKLMNAKVEELGLTGTHFVNASGLHDSDHYSTAMDIALMLEYAIESPDIGEEFLKIISAQSYVIDSTNKHKDGITLDSIALGNYSGFFIDRDEDGKADADIIGGKTGFTDEAGFSLATIYQIEDQYFICVTMKSDTSANAVLDNIMVCERYMPTYDLIDPLPSETSSSDSSSTDSDESSVIDLTPSVIDLTESEDESSEVSDDTSTDTEE